MTGNAFRSEDYVEAGESAVRLLRGDNIIQGSLRWDDAKYWATPYIEALQRYEMRAGDIVLAMDRPIVNAGLKCSVVRQQDLPSLLVQRVARVRAKKNFDQEYLAQVLQTHRFIEHLRGQKTETAIPHISPNDIREFEFPCPLNSDEQRRIAHILSTWDQAIATTERLLANGRMQWNALIGLTLHLPSANRDASAPAENSGFPASVQPGIPTLPPAPPGWRRIQLRDHLKEVRRPVALVNDETYTLVTVKRSRGGVELREVLQGNEVKTPTQFYVHADDFLISKRQIVHGACGIVPPALDGAVVSNEYAVLNTDGEIDLRFLRYLSESRYFQQTCFHSSIGVHVEKMIFKTDHWLNWPFNIPPLAQQEYIVGILDTASREIASISEQLKALKREKSALMAQLLTGKRRVHLPADETVSA
ncbi:restriction endonuclease subunit S [Xanthomonas translucens]|uniref:restriction endonuclease subunit S n=1 Tax=Xanthomonas campestris pv. translucens TaxID=343 RepID=UPI001F510B06|nr:restriction endonuclease subunit S [Xanthomonas translucens]WLA09112.1 restriction endonuclease subunit S [Xanthomonas translucens]